MLRDNLIITFIYFSVNFIYAAFRSKPISFIKTRTKECWQINAILPLLAALAL